MTTKHNHYYRDVSHLQKIDVYRVIELFDVTCPVMQHIIKKALCPGGRGHKDLRRDVQDIIDSATRKLGMMDEDEGISMTSYTVNMSADVVEDIISDIKKNGGVSGSITSKAIDDEGWIEWDGSDRNGPNVVGPRETTKVEVKFRNHDSTARGLIPAWTWDHTGGRYDIIAYRIVK